MFLVAQNIYFYNGILYFIPRKLSHSLDENWSRPRRPPRLRSASGDRRQ